MKTLRLSLVAALMSVVCTFIYLSAKDKTMVSRTSVEAANFPLDAKLKSLTRATGWLNSKPLSAIDLQGKVVLVDFWTYTCINWRRTLPYLRAWAEKYRSQGLVVVGVHTPEFGFEKDVENVRRAAKAQKV